MIEIINLERLSGDGYKMCANNPLAENLSNITHAQLRYAPFTNSQAIQGTFVANSNSTVEFDVIGQNLIRLMKLFVSTNGTNYAEVKSWGGTDGIRQKEYLVYSAVLNQTGTDAPVATVLENTLGGTVVWSYVGTGDYDATLTGAFTANKTWLSPNQTVLASADNFSIARISADVVKVTCVSDNNLSDLSIEIRVYP